MIVIETGTGAVDSVSYISAADATTFHAARGQTLWTGADSVKEAALLKAATYLDGHYRSRWRGFKTLSNTQAMEWPRYDANPYLLSTTIPQRLKDAQCELALMELIEPGVLSPTLKSSVLSEKVAIIETTYKNGASAGQVQYPAIDQLLSDYLIPSGNGRVTRG